MTTDPLAPFFSALSNLEAGGTTSQPMVIIQLGDSHTANDAFSGRMRALLQERFGNAGRGMLPPGIPFQYYRPQQVHVTAAPAWRIFSSFSHDGGHSTKGPFGLSGVRAEATAADALMTLSSDNPAGFTHAYIEILKRPGGGSLTVQADDGTVFSVPTVATHPHAEWVEVPLSSASQRLTLKPVGDGPVALLSWTTQKHGPGIVYENQGIIGATIANIAAWNPAILATELAQRQPALIIVAFGTNEGFQDNIDPAAYAKTYAAQIAVQRRLAPAAALVLVSAPDGEKLVVDTHQWAPPANLGLLREAQRNVAQEQGLFFWDWQAAMGGPGSMQRWVHQNPPWALADHVHLRAAGYQASADLLFAALMARYDQYRLLHSPRPAADVISDP